VYTAGVVLQKPVATCRYFHRSLNWIKLYETGFSPLPIGSSKERQIMRYRLPDLPHLQGIRLMEERDVQRVTELLKSYLWKFDLAPVYSEEEVTHWFLHKGDEESRVIWTYVVEVHCSQNLKGINTFRIQRPRKSAILCHSILSRLVFSKILITITFELHISFITPLQPQSLQNQYTRKD
jgi:hypothetical protein